MKHFEATRKWRKKTGIEIFDKWLISLDHVTYNIWQCQTLFAFLPWNGVLFRSHTFSLLSTCRGTKPGNLVTTSWPPLDFWSWVETTHRCCCCLNPQMSTCGRCILLAGSPCVIKVKESYLKEACLFTFRKAIPKLFYYSILDISSYWLASSVRHIRYRGAKCSTNWTNLLHNLGNV